MIPRLFQTIGLLLFFAAEPALALVICTPRTVSTKRYDYCLADVMCQPGETIGGSGGCSFRGCSPYSTRAINNANGMPVGWRCSGNSKYYEDDLYATVSVTCCKEVADPAPETPPPGEFPQAMPSSTKQTRAAKTTAVISLLGAGQAATIGAVDCAEGANQLLDPKKDGGSLVGSCFSSLAAAKELEAMAARGGETDKARVDEDILGGEGTQKTLADFEKNFGMNGKDFVRKMVAAGPSRELLASFLESKITDDKIPSVPAGAARVEAAPKAAAAEVKPAPAVAAPAAEAPAGAGGRKRQRSVASSVGEMPDTLGDSYLIMGETLTPLQGDPLLEALKQKPQAAPEIETEFEELTLFDIVRRKYRQKTMMLAPRKLLTK